MENPQMNPSGSQMSDEDISAKNEIMRQWAKSQKEMEAAQHHRRLISARSITKGKKAGRKKIFYQK